MARKPWVLGIVAAVAVAGCGGGSSRLSKAAYEQKLDSTLTRIDKRVGAAFTSYTRAASTSAGTTCSGTGGDLLCTSNGGALPLSADVRRRVRSIFEAAAAELEALRPPSDASADNATLARALRAMAPVYSAILSTPSAETAKVLKGASQSLRAAGTDLRKKGYKLGSHGLFSSESGHTPKIQEPKHVTPLPFFLVSSSGRQRAVHLDAQAETCTKSAIGTSCSSAGVFTTATVRVPGALSVVRPGEQVRFDLPAASRPFAQGVPLVILNVDNLCPGPVFPGASRFLDRPVWTVHLRPGAYVVTASFSRPSGAAQVEETGTVGLLVSRTRPLTVLPRPRCG